MSLAFAYFGLNESYINANNWTVNVVWDIDKESITFTRPDGSGAITVRLGRKQ